MRCCVRSCKNDSRNSSKSQGITFHAFPTTAAHRAAWLKALDKEQWSPRERSAVCSEHFLQDDLYVTRNGLRKVRPGAVPLIAQDTSDAFKYSAINDLQACRMCLVSGQRLYSIAHYNLIAAFERITGLSVLEDGRLPQKLCAECSQRLLSADNFRAKSLRAHSLLVEILDKQHVITAEALKSINRQTHNLASHLHITKNPPNYYNYEFTHTNEIKTSKPDTLPLIEPLELEIDIKNEDQIFVDEIKKFDNSFGENQNANEFIVENQEFNVENQEFNVENQEFNVENTEFNVENQEFNVENQEFNVENQEFNDENHDFGASDNENVFVDKEFESDDSLPLEVTRKRKKKLEGKRKKTLEKEAVKKVRKKEKKPAEPKIDRRRKPFLNQDLNETLFTVTNLTFEEQIAEIQKRQESDNYKHSVFKCTECFKGFLDQDAYNGHMTRHTNECGEHQCEICKTHFKHSHALRKHITAHHTQRFSCNQCPYITTHRQTARLHERWHKGTRYRCPHCPEEFVKFTTYMGHVRIKHPSDFVCALCGYSFVSGKGIDLHKKLKHRQAPPIPEDGPFCEQCNVRFASQEAYRKHLSVSARHTTKETREANKANKGRKSREIREREKSSKEEGDLEEGDERRNYPSQLRKAEGPIPCEQCGLQLEDSRAYHGHFRRAHPDKNRTNYPSMKSPCMCELCGRIFQSYALLKDHTWTHTGERPFKCADCGKAFRMKQRLVAHRRVHALVKASYCCTVCGKHFSTHSNRQRHMFIHTGLKPFKCEMCGKGFKHASEKRAHVTYVHLKKPWPKRSRGKRHTRQGSVPPVEANPEMEMPTVWAACDPKMADINILDDKPVYYNLKI